MIQKFAGTPLDKQKSRGKIFTTSYEPKLSYRWDSGEAIGRYLEELKQGRLIARRCNGCQRVMIPPRMFCERCFRPTDDWVYVNATGRILTFSLLCLLGRASLEATRDPRGHRNRRRFARHGHPPSNQKGAAKAGASRHGGARGMARAVQAPRKRDRHRLLGTRETNRGTEMTRSAPSKDPIAWPGTIPLTSLYTAGSGGQIFFEALKRRAQLIATRCRPCKQVYLPARSYCERCFAALTERVEVKPTGRLVSFTICHVDRDRRPLRRPRALALAQLDGATTALLHYLLDVTEPEQVKIGSRVEVIVKPKRLRHGSILDIEGFRPVKK